MERVFEIKPDRYLRPIDEMAENQVWRIFAVRVEFLVRRWRGKEIRPLPPLLGVSLTLIQAHPRQAFVHLAEFDETQPPAHLVDVVKAILADESYELGNVAAAHGYSTLKNTLRRNRRIRARRKHVSHRAPASR